MYIEVKFLHALKVVKLIWAPSVQ